MTNPFDPQFFNNSPYRRRPRRFTGMGRESEPACSRYSVDGSIRIGWKTLLTSAKPNTDDSLTQIGRHVLQALHADLWPMISDEIHDQLILNAQFTVCSFLAFN